MGAGTIATAGPPLGEMLEWAIKQHLAGLITAGVVIVLLLAITPALPANDRKRARNAVIMAMLYGLFIVVPAYLATWEYRVTDTFFLIRDFLVQDLAQGSILLIVNAFILFAIGLLAEAIRCRN